MRRSFLFLIVGIPIFLTACSTFPSEQLSFDVTQSKVPVMLTKVAGADTKDFDFEAGYSHMTITSQNHNAAGGATTATMSVGADNSKPINQQLGNFFIQDPAWVFVKNLSIADDHSIFNFVFVGVDKYAYTTAIKIAAAAGSAK